MTGPELKEKRIDARITLRQFCLDSGLDPGDVSAVERGKQYPSELFEEIYLFHLGWQVKQREQGAE